MADYIDPPLVTDAEDLAAQVYDYIEAAYPGWEANPGNWESIFTEAIASIVADAKDVARAQANEQYRAFGVSIANVPADDAVAATVSSTWTATDAAGYTIPAGTQVGIPGPDGLIVFATVDDALIAPLSTSTGAGAVVLEVVDATIGAAANGLSGTPVLIDTLAFIAGISLVGTTANGVTAETEPEYRDKLTREYRLMTPRPILPDDFALLAVNRIEGVGRARAIDGYDPVGGTYNNERTVTVVVADAMGELVAPLTKTATDTMLTAMREVNFIVNVIDPTYVSVPIVATVMAMPNYEQAEVETNVENALLTYLSPATWGAPLYGDESSSSGWNDEVIVRLYEIAEVINGADGVHYITALTVHGSAADYTMTGVSPLPKTLIADIAVTVNLP